VDAAEGPLSANSLIIDHLMMEQLTTLAVARLTNVFQLILRSPLVQSWLVEKIEKNVKGPDAAKRNASRTWVWGEARDARGRQHEIRIVTLNGYSLTIFSSLAIAEHLMSNDAPPGCGTPVGLMGENFILSLPGTSKLDLSRPSA
jgi:short subunit dehydrogenase-like uncharacterized protein